ncbi:hypothetical protein BJ996_007084 [Streptomyces phaeogriseichromatogenes]|nr:hypothetical protein [Streptomyces murinus]
MKAWTNPNRAVPIWRVGTGIGRAIPGCGPEASELVLARGIARPRRSPMWCGPVLGSGFLGGFTTFSAFASDVQRLPGNSHGGTGVPCAAGTITGALAACAGGRALTAGLIPARGTGRAS